MSEAKQQQQTQAPRVDEDTRGMLGAGGGGSNDVTSGGGNATGTPDAETAMRVGGAALRGDVEEDKKKIFPETNQQPGQNAR